MYFLTGYIEKLICENSNTNNNIADQSHIIHSIAINMTIITRSMSKPTKNNAKKETMYLRSVKKTATFSVDIDFDEASLAWNSNKQPVGNGCFVYKTYEKSKRTRRAPQRYSE